MQTFIRAALWIAGVVGIITIIGKRLAPRVTEYSAASQEFWSNPRVIKARRKAWEHARRSSRIEARAAQT